MKFKIPTEGGDDEINMAPMIDMVFLLLIFFMVASHMASVERVPVPLPVADKAKVPEDIRDRQLVTLLATDDSGGKVEIFMNLQKMDMQGFASEMEKKVAGNDSQPVYLRVDRRLRQKYVRQVMAICADAGIADVIFGVLESGS
jgi:biopolymer transport protein ExbD